MSTALEFDRSTGDSGQSGPGRPGGCQAPAARRGGPVARRGAPAPARRRPRRIDERRPADGRPRRGAVAEHRPLPRRPRGAHPLRRVEQARAGLATLAVTALVTALIVVAILLLAQWRSAPVSEPGMPGAAAVVAVPAWSVPVA
ncbi:hypothetical protein [Nocardia harenae]|uniref:hypothetical protein n=1 Tax=Nocardia harenae TaxID=358707 RepID=UPI0008373DCD|nr:hypothetical protein [Nocardia harenae]